MSRLDSASVVTKLRMIKLRALGIERNAIGVGWAMLATTSNTG